MKELRGNANAEAGAPVEEALALLEAVDGYPSWYPEVVSGVEVLDQDSSGTPSRIRTTLHVSQGPISRDFELTMAVAVERPHTVRLTRIPHEPTDPERFDVVWQLSGTSRARISLDLLANLDVPRFVPVGAIGNSIAQGFVDAAVRRLGA